MAYEDEDYGYEADDSYLPSEAAPTSGQQPKDDWEPYVPPAAKAAVARSKAADDDWEPYNPDAIKPEGRMAAITRELANEAGPAVAGAVAGGVASGAAGSVAGPWGAIGGALAGGIAGGYGASVLQDKGKQALNLDDSPQRAANAKEYPIMVPVTRAAANIVGGGLGAVPKVVRAIGAGLGGGVATGTEIYDKGKDFFTPEGFKEALPNIAAQAAGGALFAKPRGYVNNAEAAAARFGNDRGGQWTRGADGGYTKGGPPDPPPPPPPAGPAQGDMAFGQPGTQAAGGSPAGQQMAFPFHEAPQPYNARADQSSVIGHPDLPNMRSPIQEQGQLDLPSPDAPAQGKFNNLESRGDIASQVEPPSPRMPAPGEGGGQGQLFPDEGAGVAHGSPGPVAAAGVAEAPPPVARPGEGAAAHGPEDWGKKTPAQASGGGVNVGQDVTLGAVFKQPETPQPGIPFMITNEMKAALREQGYSDVQIKTMTPAQAHEVLNPQRGRPVAEQPTPPRAAEVPIASAADADRTRTGFKIEKNPDGTYSVNDSAGNAVSTHPNLGQAYIALNKAAAANRGEIPPVKGVDLPPRTPGEQPIAARGDLPPPEQNANAGQKVSPQGTPAEQPARAPRKVAPHEVKQARQLRSTHGIKPKDPDVAAALAADDAKREAQAARRAKKGAAAAETKPKTTKEVVLDRDVVSGDEKKGKVVAEDTFRGMLEKHGTRPGLMPEVTKFIKDAVMKEIGNMPVYTVPKRDLVQLDTPRQKVSDAYAFYDRKLNHIIVNEAVFKASPQTMAHAVLHEGVHGVTAHAIVHNAQAKKAITAIMGDIARQKGWRADDVPRPLRYGFINEREFLSEAFSNPQFQQMLKEHELSPTLRDALNKFFQSPIKTAWDVLVQTVRKVLGVPADKTTALEATIKATERAMGLNPPEKAAFLKKHGTEDANYIEPLGVSPKDPPMATATKEDKANDIWTGIKRWVGANASATESGRMARNNIMSKEGGTEHIRQQAHAAFTNEMHRRINAMSADSINKLGQVSIGEQRMLVNYIQGGKDFPNYKPPPDVKGIVDVLRDIHLKVENTFRAMPEFEQMQFWDNDKYLAGQYKNTRQAQNFYKDHIGAGGSGSTKKKVYPTDEDARRAGLVPISTNPIERVLRYTDSITSYISYRQQIAEGKAAGYIKYFSPETVAAAGTPDPYVRGRPPEGWSPIRGLKDGGGRQAWAPTEYATVFNNFHGNGLANTPETKDLVNAIRRTSNAFTALELGVATYHAFTTVHERIGSDWSTAISQAASGDLAGAGKTFASALAAPVKEVWGPSSHGKRLQDVYTGKVVGTPNEQAIVNAMKAANFKPINAKHTLDYDMSKAGSFYNSYVKGSLVPEMVADYKAIVGDKNWKEGMTFIPRMAGRMMQTIAAPLFEHYIPRMKTAAFAVNVNAWMKANPDFTPQDLQNAAIKIGKSIDNRMGEMAHDNMMMNRALRDAASMTLRSFSFTIGGVFREIGGGTLSLAKGAMKGENRLSLSSKNYDPRSAYAVAFPIAVASMGMLYQFLKTGKGPDEWRDLIWPETGGKQAGVGKGRSVPERALLPGYHKDIAAYIAHPTREAQNKLAGLWTAIGEQIAGERMTEVGKVPIVPPKATLGEAALARAKAFGEKATPIFVRTATKTPQKQTNISYPEQLVGLRAPGKWASDPVGQKIADDKRAEKDWRSSERRLNTDRIQRGEPVQPRRYIPRGDQQ